MNKIIKELQSVLLITFRKTRFLFYKLLNKPRIYYDENSYLKIYKFKNLDKYNNCLKIYKDQVITNIDVLKSLKSKIKS